MREEGNHERHEKHERKKGREMEAGVSSGLTALTYRMG